MALPKAIEAQVAQAEALHQQLYSESQADQTQPVSEPQTANESAEREVPLQEQAAPVEQVETPAKSEPAREDTVDYWRDRFKTMDGKYGREVPQLQAKLRELELQNQRLVDFAEEAVRRQEQKPESTKDEPLVSKEDVDEFGSDLTDFVRRVAHGIAKSEIAKVVEQYRSEFASVREEVGRVANTTTAAKGDLFELSMTRLVPDWASVNKDESWIEFLNGRVPGTRTTYRTEANTAIAEGDLQYVAEIVGVWREQNTAPAPQVQQSPTRQRELERQVAPSSSKANSTTPVNAGKIWSRQEYESAMDVRNTSRYGKAKADELEAEATRAVAEGRVRW